MWSEHWLISGNGLGSWNESCGKLTGLCTPVTWLVDGPLQTYRMYSTTLCDVRCSKSMGTSIFIVTIQVVWHFIWTFSYIQIFLCIGCTIVVSMFGYKQSRPPLFPVTYSARDMKLETSSLLIWNKMLGLCNSKIFYIFQELLMIFQCQNNKIIIGKGKTCFSWINMSSKYNQGGEIYL